MFKDGKKNSKNIQNKFRNFFVIFNQIFFVNIKKTQILEKVTKNPLET